MPSFLDRLKVGDGVRVKWFDKWQFGSVMGKTGVGYKVQKIVIRIDYTDDVVTLYNDEYKSRLLPNFVVGDQVSDGSGWNLFSGQETIVSIDEATGEVETEAHRGNLWSEYYPGFKLVPWIPKQHDYLHMCITEGKKCNIVVDVVRCDTRVVLSGMWHKLVSGFQLSNRRPFPESNATFKKLNDEIELTIPRCIIVPESRVMPYEPYQQDMDPKPSDVKEEKELPNSRIQDEIVGPVIWRSSSSDNPTKLVLAEGAPIRYDTDKYTFEGKIDVVRADTIQVQLTLPDGIRPLVVNVSIDDKNLRPPRSDLFQQWYYGLSSEKVRSDADKKRSWSEIYAAWPHRKMYQDKLPMWVKHECFFKLVEVQGIRSANADSNADAASGNGRDEMTIKIFDELFVGDENWRCVVIDANSSRLRMVEMEDIIDMLESVMM